MTELGKLSSEMAGPGLESCSDDRSESCYLSPNVYHLHNPISSSPLGQSPRSLPTLDKGKFVLFPASARPEYGSTCDPTGGFGSLLEPSSAQTPRYLIPISCGLPLQSPRLSVAHNLDGDRAHGIKDTFEFGTAWTGMDDADELLMLYDGPTTVLDGRDLPSIARFMKSPQCKRVFVMLGAGVSTAAGIPDFRSPRTGLYANLAKLNLPYPRALFELNYFRFNPIPFFTLTHELYPGRFRPTLTHSFVKLLADSGLLHTCFTQNIDTLERQAGVPLDRLVEAHGSFASQHCIDCKKEYDSEKMRLAVEKGEVVYCDKKSCLGLVKPDVVFFGESLPELLSQSIPRISSADLLFVIGTSLTIQPFAKLASMAPETCPRVLINLDFAGDIGTRADDVLLLGKCDSIVRDLCRELGWADALEREWAKTELPSSRPSTGILSPKDNKLFRGVRDALPLHEQVEIGRLGGSGNANGTSTPTAAEWQEKLDAAGSITERLRVALESSEKIVPLMEEAAVTFAARTLSAEELLLATNAASDSGDSTPVDETSYILGGTAIAVEGRL